LPLNSVFKRGAFLFIRKFKKTTTAVATGMSLNKRFNEQNNECAHFLAVLYKTTT